MDRACKIFENITGVEMSLYEGAMFMHCYEMARMRKNRRNLQGLMSSIDYLALSGQFAVAGFQADRDGALMISRDCGIEPECQQRARGASTLHDESRFVTLNVLFGATLHCTALHRLS